MIKDFKALLTVFLIFLVFVVGAVAQSQEDTWLHAAVKPFVQVAGAVGYFINFQQHADAIRWTNPAPEQTDLRSSYSAAHDKAPILYVTTQDTTARLIDRTGQVLHTWPFQFDKAWSNQNHVLYPSDLPNEAFYLRDFHLDDNGDLTTLVSVAGVTPWGAGLVKMDKDANVIWTYTGHINNDFEQTANGTIYAVEHIIRSDAPGDYAMPYLPFLEDNISIINANDGSLEKRISLIDAILNSPYRDMLHQLQFSPDDDPTHSNSIEVIEKSHPDVWWLQKGMLLISVRDLNALVVLDPQTEQIVYAASLPLRHQHDVDYLDNGHILMFDNQGSFKEGGYSRIYEFDPKDMAQVWTFEGSQSAPFHTEFFGTQERLANGNTLIIDAEHGRIFEVTTNKEIVWDYYAPLTQTIKGTEYIATITHAQTVAHTDQWLHNQVTSEGQ